MRDCHLWGGHDLIYWHAVSACVQMANENKDAISDTLRLRIPHDLPA